MENGKAVTATFKEIVPTGEIDVADLTPRQSIVLQKVTAANLERLIQDAEALVQFSNRIKTVALKATAAPDWILLGGNPYLRESGVKTLLRLIGASVFDVSVDEEIQADPKLGRVGFFLAEGKIAFNGAVLTNIGVASTKDSFFAKRKKEDGSEYWLSYDEVDRSNVRKKAVTNLHKRLLDMVLKLSPTVQELEAAGIRIENKVNYGQGSKGGTTDSAAEKDDRVKLKSALARLASLTGEPAADLLKKMTAFNDFAGYTEADKVSPKMLSKTLKAVENRIAEMDKADASQPAAGTSAPANGNGQAAPANNQKPVQK